MYRSEFAQGQLRFLRRRSQVGADGRIRTRITDDHQRHDRGDGVAKFRTFPCAAERV